MQQPLKSLPACSPDDRREEHPRSAALQRAQIALVQGHVATQLAAGSPRAEQRFCATLTKRHRRAVDALRLPRQPETIAACGAWSRLHLAAKINIFCLRCMRQRRQMASHTHRRLALPRRSIYSFSPLPFLWRQAAQGPRRCKSFVNRESLVNQPGSTMVSFLAPI